MTARDLDRAAGRRSLHQDGHDRTALRRLSAGREPRVLELPALVKGELVWPSRLSADQLDRLDHLAPGREPVRVAGAYVLPGPGAGDGRRFTVRPYADASALIETDPGHLAGCLHDQPFDDVLRFAADLQALLRPDGELVTGVLAALDRPPTAGPAGPTGPNQRARPASEPRPSEPLQRALLEMLAGLFDPGQIAAAVAVELDHPGARGRDLLDGWVRAGTGQQEGVNVRLADAVFAEPGRPGPAYPRHPAVLRAVPTRQLHITAGNSPLIPALSLVRALSTKGAAVIKCPAGSELVSTLLALALHRLAPAHPQARHTSLVHWCGGDRQVEDPLLAAGAFDRVVAWGGEEAISSIRRRTTTRTVLFEPRIGISLIGRDALGPDRDGPELTETIVRATADSLIENQTACTASLVHYLEADEGDAIRYCQALQAALARWDAALPHRTSPAAQALLRRWRRDALVGARWFVNGHWPDVTSAVVYARQPVDLSGHPMSRCVVVRRVADLGAVLPLVDRRTAAAGVWPLNRWAELRDALAARGVTTVAPLGECERRWPGMPHDGLLPLAELVNWSVA